MATKKEKPVMLGTRISPKLQYGLRLLSRVQGRTIADAVEWSINLALRQTRVGGGIQESRLNKVVDAVWDMPSDAHRIYFLNRTAPELLDFEERATWNLVSRCDDLWQTAYYGWVGNQGDEDEGPGDSVRVRVSADDPERDKDLDDEQPNFVLIEKHWDAIRFVGTALGRAGEIEMRFSLAEILDGSALKRAGAD